jgi:hypothetical protein
MAEAARPGPPPGAPRPHHPQRGTVRSTGALGNLEGESGLPPAAVDGAQPTAAAKRCASCESGRHPVTCNISPALKHAPVANPGER